MNKKAKPEQMEHPQIGKRFSAFCPLCEREVDSILVEDCQGGYKMLRCPICALEFAHPFKGPGKEGYEEVYKEGEYQGKLSFSKKPRLNERHLWTIKYLRRLLPSPDCRKILEAGCAEGGFLKTMEKIGFEVYGFDIAEEPIRFAREVHNLKNVIASTVEELPSDWGDFDIITAFDVLEHLDNPLSFLKSLYNLLKPGGILILSLPYYETWAKLRKKGSTADHPPLHLTRWPPQTLRLALEKVGFAGITLKSISVYSWPHFLESFLPWRLLKLYRKVSGIGGSHNEFKVNEGTIRNTQSNNMKTDPRKIKRWMLKWTGRAFLYPLYLLSLLLMRSNYLSSRIAVAMRPLSGGSPSSLVREDR